jgi:hypothetical protein
MQIVNAFNETRRAQHSFGFACSHSNSYDIYLFIYLFTFPSYLYIHWMGNHNNYCQLQRPPIVIQKQFTRYTKHTQ